MNLSDILSSSYPSIDNRRSMGRLSMARLPIFSTNDPQISVNVSRPRREYPRTLITSTLPSSVEQRAESFQSEVPKNLSRKSVYAPTVASSNRSVASNPVASSRKTIFGLASTGTGKSITTPKSASSSVSTTNSAISIGTEPLKCKYCDRKFEKKFALDNHLQQNCSKIPPNDRRKMFSGGSDTNIKSTKSNGKVDSTTNFNKFLNRSERLNRLLTDLNNDANANIDDYNNKFDSRKKSIKSIGHTGLFRTPSKAVKCKICKMAFMDCVEYAEHTLMHNKKI